MTKLVKTCLSKWDLLDDAAPINKYIDGKIHVTHGLSQVGSNELAQFQIPLTISINCNDYLITMLEKEKM